ncbi:MAG: hypothetical protein VKJ02_05970 [Snowella sp.]|nr:hypothetical protein [Snowella sp.]
MIILIDSGVLGILSNPNESAINIKCEEWLYNKIVKGCTILSSQICKYEVKKSLLLVQEKTSFTVSGTQKLTELENLIDFIDVKASDIEIACQLWVQSIVKGIQVAPSMDINFDIIICAQFRRLELENPGREVVIATTNLRHLQRFAKADLWENL